MSTVAWQLGARSRWWGAEECGLWEASMHACMHTAAARMSEHGVCCTAHLLHTQALRSTAERSGIPCRLKAGDAPRTTPRSHERQRGGPSMPSMPSMLSISNETSVYI